MLFGVSLWSPKLVRPLAEVAGWPLERLRGLTGRLARENSQRNPGRTAATAAALMIGLALVSFVTVFAAGLKASIATAIDQNFNGQLVLQNSNGFDPIPSAAATAVTKVPGVQTVSTLRSTQVKVAGEGKARASGLDPKTANRVLSIDYQDGSSPRTLENLKDNGVIADKSYLDGTGLNVGDGIRVLGQTGKVSEFRIAGSFKDNANLLGDMVVTQGAMARDFATSQDVFDFIDLAPGANTAAVQAKIKPILTKEFPTTEVLNQDQLKSSQQSPIDRCSAWSTRCSRWL